MNAATSISPPLGAASDVAVSTSAAPRLAFLDATRLLAAAGVVCIHAVQSEPGQALYPVGMFGVPFYILVAMLFMARKLTRDPSIPLSQYVASRFTRVYVPFLAWSAVYVLLAEAKSMLIDHRLPELPISILWAGGHQHLWFLPYLMCVTVFGAMLVRSLYRTTVARWIAIVCLAILGVVVALVPEPHWVAGRVVAGDLEFWRYGLRALPSVCWALAIALATASHGSLPRTTGVLAAMGAVGFVVATWLYWPVVTHLPEMTRLLRACEGVSVLMLALWPVRAPLLERIGVLGRHSYGVYLSHIVFVRLAVLWLAHYHVTPSIGVDVGIFLFALCGAVTLTVLMSRSRYTRWALGE